MQKFTPEYAEPDTSQLSFTVYIVRANLKYVATLCVVRELLTEISAEIDAYWINV